MIRAATSGDLSRIAEILVFGKRTAYRGIFQDDAGSFNRLQVLDVVRDYQEHANLLGETLVYDDGIVKGVLTRSDCSEHDLGETELRELYVEPCFIGEGVGSRLVAFLLEEARQTGRKRVSLWVIRDNAAARRFYERLGFTPTGEERPVEGTSVAELRYALRLQA